MRCRKFVVVKLKSIEKYDVVGARRDGRRREVPPYTFCQLNYCSVLEKAVTWQEHQTRTRDLAVFESRSLPGKATAAVIGIRKFRSELARSLARQDRNT